MMPAKSQAQRKAMGIAEHHPEELYKRNKGMPARKRRACPSVEARKSAKALALKRGIE